jgi:hypothetical protein
MREIPWLEELLRTTPEFAMGRSFGAASAGATRQGATRRAGTTR